MFARASRHISVILLPAAVVACQTSPTSPNTAVTAVTVTASPNPAQLATTVQATATVQPSNAPQNVTWSSSNNAIATVDASGTITLHLMGTATITATSTADPTKSGSVTLTVVCPTPRLVSANISVATTWQNWVPDPQCFDYVVEADIQTNSQTLTIEAGTVVGFQQGRGMRIRIAATLIAEGTAADPIVLTGTTKARGWWKGLALETTTHANNVLAHVTVEYTGDHQISGTQPASLIVAGNASARVENSTFQESDGYGVSLSRDAAFTGNGGNAFTRNALGAAWSYGTAVPNLNNAILTGNDVDVVVVTPNTITTPMTWPTALYHLLRAGEQAFSVLAGGQLTLSPGSTLRFEGDQSVVVMRGGLSAVGTAAAPIVFTGTQQVRGHWGGIGFLGTDLAMNRLEHVVVEYAGGRTIGESGSEKANVVVRGAGAGEFSRVTIRNSTLRQALEYGLWVERDNELTDFTGNTLTGNALGAAWVHAPVVDDLLASNVFTGNDTDEVAVETGSSMQIDRPATWRDLGVPYHLQYNNGPATEVWADLTIEPGVEMLMEQQLGIIVRNGGNSKAIGQPNNRITMRAKGAAWQGLNFLDTTGDFDYIDIMDGGSHAWGGVLQPGNITISAAATSAIVVLQSAVTLTNAPFGIVFSHGPSIAVGCPGSVFVPPPDLVSDHCH